MTDNRLADLKRIEQLALDELEKTRYGPHYEGRVEDSRMLEDIARKAKIERLKLELAQV